jgi:hypothetical protein
MKLVHKSLTACIFSFCVSLMGFSPAAAQNSANQPAYLRFFDPAQGFKPAQKNLTNIFLQIAGSLECTGSPELYIRHVQAEHARLSEKFAAKMGKPLPSRLPPHMKPENLDRLIANWNILSAKFQLDALAKEAGRCAREGIRGSRDTGTIAILVFNDHQKLVADEMRKKPDLTNGFELLRARLDTELEWEHPKPAQTPAEMAQREAALTEAERQEYAELLKHVHFTRAEFPKLEHFYSHGYDKLSDVGKNQMSQRIWDGIRSAKPADLRKDAIIAAHDFHDALDRLYAKLDERLPAEKAALVKRAVPEIFLDIGELAQAELEIGILDWSLGD